jgi:hypothetical protein
MIADYICQVAHVTRAMVAEMLPHIMIGLTTFRLNPMYAIRGISWVVRLALMCRSISKKMVGDTVRVKKRISRGDHGHTMSDDGGDRTAHIMDTPTSKSKAALTSDVVTNLSSYELSASERSLLSKSLKFIPDRTKIDSTKLFWGNGRDEWGCESSIMNRTRKQMA